MQHVPFETLGICLGAQLLAEAIGGKVRPNCYREIDWFPVELTEAAKQSPAFRGFPERFVPFHWHGDTFELPDRAVRTASSKGCRNQHSSTKTMWPVCSFIWK